MIVQTDPRAPRVVLVGPPGAGKSTIGRKLARELGVELYDTDTGIEREIGRTIPEIFATDGEPEFRRIEERVVRRAILAERGVVSLPVHARAREDTRGAVVVHLDRPVFDVQADGGRVVVRPQGLLGTFAAITVFSDPRVFVESLGAELRGNDYLLSARARLR